MSAPSAKRTAIQMPSERPKGSVPRKPRLVVIAGPELGRQISLESGDVSIGRDEASTVFIDSELVSRKHSSIQRFAGKHIIADLGSTNGTFVNDAKVKTHTLVDGDQIRVGKVILKYTEDEIEARYHEQIRNLVNVDALTGAFNKRYFEEVIGKTFSASRAAGTPLSLMVFDIDFFKKINDTYGHAAGDHVLREVSAIVRGLARPTDTFCRVGGEEFAVILPDTRRSGALTAAELTRGTIEMSRFEFEGKVIPVTTSLGVAEIAPDDANPVAFYKRADERLYEAKRSGRNRVC